MRTRQRWNEKALVFVDKEVQEYSVRDNNCQNFVRELAREWRKFPDTFIKPIRFRFVTKETNSQKLSKQLERLDQEVHKLKNRTPRTEAAKRRKSAKLEAKLEERERVKRDIEKISQMKRRAAVF